MLTYTNNRILLLYTKNGIKRETLKKQLVIDNINSSKKLGVALRRFRKANGWTQLELSKKANIRQGPVSEVENGRGNIETFLKIVQSLKLNVVMMTGSLESKTSEEKNSVMDLL